MPRVRVPHRCRTPGPRPRRARDQRRLRRRIRFGHHRPGLRLDMPGGRQMNRAGQHEGHRGAGGHYPRGDPRRAPRPRPATPRMPAPAPPRLTPGHQRHRSHRSHRSRQSHRGHRSRQSHGSHGNTPQLRHQLARPRPALRLFGQAPAHQRPQFTRQPAEVRRAVDQPVHEQSTRPGAERPLSATRVHQHRTQAENVARRPRILSQRLLRRQVPRRQHVRASNSRNPEPRDPRPVAAQQDVRGVEIPVHQPRVVNGAQPRGQPGGQQQQGRGRHRPPVAHRLGQRRPGHVRGGQPRNVGVQVRGDHRRGERAVHPAGRGDLGPEPRIGGHVGLDDPHRDALPARRQAQEQPVSAQRLGQLVRPDRSKRNYHPESPLSVAATAIPTDSDPKQRSQLCIRHPNRDRAVTRPAATRNDFGTVRSYGGARSGRINDEVRGILSRGGD
jgi:hypothetical protein